FGQVLVVGALAFDQVRNGVEAQPVDAETQPEPHDREYRFEHAGIVEIQVGLMRVEAMPVIGAGFGVPRPVRALGVNEDDPGPGIFLVATRPAGEIARGGSGLGAPRGLKPGMLVRRVIDNQLGDHAKAARMCGSNESLEVAEGPVPRMYGFVVADAVAVVETG